MANPYDNNPYVQVRGGVGGFYPTPSSDSSPTKNEHQTESLCMVLENLKSAKCGFGIDSPATVSKTMSSGTMGNYVFALFLLGLC